MSDLKSNNKSSATARKDTKTVKKVVASINEKEKNIIDYNIRPDLTSGVFGAIDGLTSEGISGWLINVSTPTVQLDVQIYINNVPVATGITNVHRPDISNIIGSPTNCGFCANWKKDELAKAIVNLEPNQLCPIMILLDGEIKFISSAITPSVSEIKELLCAEPVDGYFDQVDENLIATGWAIIPNQEKEISLFVTDKEAEFARLSINQGLNTMKKTLMRIKS